MPAALNYTRDRLVIDNLVAVTVTNQDGTTASTPYALKRGVQSSMSSQGGVDVVTFSCRWHIWKEDLDGMVPRENGHVVDPHGDRWLIDSVNYLTNGTRYELSCTLEAGLDVR